MCRIVEFPVGKTGRLIQSSDTFLNGSTGRFGSGSVRTFDCAFLSPSGVIQKIYVPVHALTSRSTSHDRTLHKQLKTILFQGKISESQKNLPMSHFKTSRLSTQKCIKIFVKEFLLTIGNPAIFNLRKHKRKRLPQTTLI